MDTVTISSKFQIVIPSRIRKQFHLKPGQKLMFIPYENNLRIVIIPPIEEMRGKFPGIDTHVEREEEDRV